MPKPRDISEWSAQANCLGSTDSMYVARGDTAAFYAAKRICADCPVHQDCFEYIMEYPQRYGIWAGLNWKEAARIRKIIRTNPPRNPDNATS